MSIVDEPVENGVSERRIADGIVPMIDGQLAGNDCRAAAVTVFEDFQQVPTFGRCEHGQPPIIEDQDVEPGNRLEESGVTPIPLCDGKRFEEARDAVIGDSTAVAAGFVAKGTGDPTLSEASRAGDQQVLVAVDPCAVDEVRHHCSVDAARGAQVEIFHAGRLSEGCELEPGGQPLGIAFSGFAVDQQTEAVLEAEGFEGGI